MKKIGWVLATLLCMLLTGVTVYLASSFKTTEQKAAEAAAPPPSTITATVERRTLENTLALTCTVDYSQKRALTVSTAASGAQFTSIDVTEGERLTNGSLVAEINGQPVFTVLGGFSFYRDLNLKDRGPDARLLNQALTAMGYQYARTGADQDLVDAETYRALNRLRAFFNYPALEENQPIAASQFIVLPEEVQVVSKPRSTGDVDAGAIATLSSGQQKVACKPATGTVTDDITSGLKARLPELGSEEYPVTVASKDASGAEAGQGDTGALTGEGSAGAAAGNAGSGSNTSGERYLSITASATATEGKTRLNGELILASSGEPGLVVPSSALFTTTEGTQLTLVEADGSQHTQKVTVGFSAQGYSVVSPQGGSLTEGDSVLLPQEG
ncbi:MAG: hypothetical protein Q3965_04100 [Rothia sp. (in: high G+C Gram-positive bacteria)]|nr:hypothetical protein [Rothia sp. (in: high G+C Gram-positive bacteria)]